MGTLEIILIALAALLLLAVFNFILIGETLVRRFLKRGNLAEKVIRFQMDMMLNLYKVDFDWWQKFPFEKVCVKTKDNISLYPLVLPKENSKKVAIIVHGYLARPLEMNMYAEMFMEQGYNIIVTQNRAHGESQGEYIELNKPNDLDLLKIIDYAIERFGKDCEIVLFGLSMGGAIVCLASGANLPSNVKKIISDSAYTNLYDEFKCLLASTIKFTPNILLWNFNAWTKIRFGTSLKEHSSLEAIKRNKLPILIIHGSADNFVPCEMAYQLKDACPTNLCKLVTFEKSTHCESLPSNTQEYKQLVEEFLSENSTKNSKKIINKK